MAHLFRFFGRRHGDLNWTLIPDEWLHINKVLRLKSGIKFEVTDGAGWLAECTLISVGNDHGEFVVQDESHVSETSPEFRRVSIAIGALKPQAIDEFLPSLVEQGIEEIIVFASEGSSRERMSEKIKERWNRVIIAASKQSKRLWLPRIVWLDDIRTMIQYCSPAEDTLKIFFDPSAVPRVQSVLLQTRDPVLAVIGSEKGFTSTELEALRAAGYLGVNMGHHVLRSVTAVISAGSLLKNIMP